MKYRNLILLFVLSVSMLSWGQTSGEVTMSEQDTIQNLSKLQQLKEQVKEHIDEKLNEQMKSAPVPDEPVWQALTESIQ